VVGQAPERQCLELALGEDDGQGCVAKGLLADVGRYKQHVGPARRAEVFLSGLQIPGEVVFEVGLIPAQPVLAYAIGAGVEVRNHYASIVAGFAADDLAPVSESTRRRPARTTMSRSIQRDSSSAKSEAIRSDPTRPYSVEFSSIVCGQWSWILPLKEFTFHPYGSMARVAAWAIVISGPRATAQNADSRTFRTE